MFICITDLFMDENNDFRKNKNNYGLWTTYFFIDPARRPVEMFLPWSSVSVPQ